MDIFTDEKRQTYSKKKHLYEVFKEVVDSDPTVNPLFLTAQNYRSSKVERKGFDFLFDFLKNLRCFVRIGNSEKYIWKK